jgi:hypothetical protein
METVVMAVTITIAEEITHLTGGNSTVQVATGTVNSCLQELFSLYPQLYVFLVDNNASEAKRVLVILNDEELLENSDRGKLLSSEDTIHIFYGIPVGAYGEVALAEVLGEFMSAAAAEIAAKAIVQVVTNIIINIIVSLVISALIGALTDNVATPESTIAGNSNTYTFDGIRNSTASGTPLGLVYGTHRVGGQILSMFTELTSDYNTTLLYQIGLSEGEISSIDEVEINNLPYTYYNAVEFEKRYGTTNQTTMLEFNKVENTTSIMKKAFNISNPPPPAAPIKVGDAPVYGVCTARNTVMVGPYKFVWVEVDYNWNGA